MAFFDNAFTGGGAPSALFSAAANVFYKAPPPQLRREAASEPPAPAPAPAERARGAKRAAPEEADSDDERAAARKSARQQAAAAARARGLDAQSRRAVARGGSAVVVEPLEPVSEAKPKRKRDPAAAPRERATPAEEADAAARTVFVGNLPAGIKPRRLRQLFAPCGRVASVRLRSVAIDPEAKVPRRVAVLTGQLNGAVEAVNGYVVFAEAAALPAALALNMTLVDGRHVRVDAVAAEGSGRAAAQLDPCRSIYLGNLHFAVDDEEVIAAFSRGGAAAPLLRAGCVEAVRVPRDRATGRSRGFALLCFRDAACVKQALQLAGKLIKGRPVRVARASAKQAALAASAKAATAEAHAALVNLPARTKIGAPAAAEAPAAPTMARWKARAMKAAAAGDEAAAAMLEGAPRVGPATSRPAAWEGVHALPSARPAALGGATGGKVRTKPRWRDQGRDTGTPLAALPALPKRVVPSGKPKARGVGAKLGAGKQGGVKRISGRKRPAVAARKKAVEVKKRKG